MTFVEEKAVGVVAVVELTLILLGSDSSGSVFVLANRTGCSVVQLVVVVGLVAFVGLFGTQAQSTQKGLMQERMAEMDKEAYPINELTEIDKTIAICINCLKQSNKIFFAQR